MQEYTLTVFEKNGQLLLEQSFQANNDQSAKQKGTEILNKENFAQYTHRCVSEDGRLILFSR
ncbi:YhzD family protein [Salirhabdus salicampi]|uniref:YhzD family protein n=1 Tax=Salirhabdus salicampi TaxID=476102 RepID=UPI0020C303BA|nr:YhzD family protein [Salirhabdus salicampi]MCP8615490.1 hypothetical protein [Salirhabdus salicampi]